MTRRTNSTLMILLSVSLTAVLGPGARSAQAQRNKWATPPYVPLSKKTPDIVTQLPSFGRIEWTVEAIPWVAKGPGAGISGAGVVLLDGHIYVMGGFIPGGDETKDGDRRTSRWAYRYEITTAEWTRLPNVPGRREYTRAITAPHAVYVVGGGDQADDTGRPYSPFADCFKLDVAATPLAWQLQGKLSVPRTHMGVGRVGDHLIVVGGNEYNRSKGGYHHSTFRGTTDVLHLDHPEKGWQPRAPIPGDPRGWIASAVCRDHLYVLGGLTYRPAGKKSKSVRLAETLRYDPKRDRWTRLADPPLPISGWEGATYGDRYIIVIGGVVGPDTLWNDLPFVYDVQEDRWSKIDSPIPVGATFNDSGVCITGDTIYVIGGEGPRGSHFNHFLIGRIKPAG